MAHKIPICEIPLALLLFGLNGVVILNGVAGGTRSAVFFSVLLLGETLTPPAGWTRRWC